MRLAYCLRGLRRKAGKYGVQNVEQISFRWGAAQTTRQPVGSITSPNRGWRTDQDGRVAVQVRSRRRALRWHNDDNDGNREEFFKGQPFLAPSGKIGDWNYGNVRSAGGVCLVAGDRLCFFMSGRAGVAGRRASGDTFTGLASIRRDGFVSLDADFDSRSVTTRQVQFNGKALFLNVDAGGGEVRMEVLDAKGAVVPGFSAADSIALHSDNTLAAVRWRGGADLSKLAGKPVKLRFILRNARLFSFWVSPDECGSSQGYVAAGGPGFHGSRDTEGMQAYQCCRPDVW